MKPNKLPAQFIEKQYEHNIASAAKQQPERFIVLICAERSIHNMVLPHLEIKTDFKLSMQGKSVSSCSRILPFSQGHIEI